MSFDWQVLLNQAEAYSYLTQAKEFCPKGLQDEKHRINIPVMLSIEQMFSKVKNLESGLQVLQYVLSKSGKKSVSDVI